MSCRNNFVSTLEDVGISDERLVVLVGDISHFRLQPFAEQCPGRYYNVGICENTIVSMASGLSMLGFIPVVHTISPFLLERSYEQIKLDFAYQKLAGNILTVGSAFDYADLGCTHHSYGDFALMKTIPGVNILYPASDLEFDTLFKQTYNNGQVNVYRLPYHNHSYPFRKGDIKFSHIIPVREGEDITIVAIGSQLETVLHSLQDILEKGISPEILYVHTIRPLDSARIIESIRKTKKCLVIEEHSMYGGVYDDILRFSKDIHGITFDSINLGDQFIREYGTYAECCQNLGFTTENILGKSIRSCK
jgi:transketolase